MVANIVLTGFMGTGKSTIARLLAAALGREFIDTDVLIIARHGEIADIFLERGEAAFREIERELATELASRDGLVVASGGGMLLDAEVADVIGREARVFCLTAESDTILARVVGDKSGTVRPLLVGPDPAGRVTDLLAQRAIRYRAFEQVPTDDRTPDDVVADIIARLSVDELTAHYGRSTLIAELEAALTAAEPEVDSRSPDVLAGFDEFHLGGRLATQALIDSLGLQAGDAVLDVGCGVGGAARVIAATAGCSVIGIDLTPEFVETARWLSDRVGMAEQTDFRVASALALPFEGDAFEAVTMLHVGMNIADKEALLVELARVLAPGGRVGIYDIMRAGEGDLEFPLPWSAGPETSFLSSPDHYIDAISAAGLTVVSSDDRRPLVLDAIGVVRESPPLVDLSHLMGDDWPRMQANMIRAFRAGTVSPFQILARK